MLHAVDTESLARNLHQRLLTSSTDQSSAFYSFRTDKFCVGFEMVHSFQGHHFLTWEHMRIMLMFLRRLRFSYSGGLIQKSGGCWQDVRYQVNHRKFDGLRRVGGLGFRRTMEQYGYA